MAVRVRDVMTTEVVTVTPETSFKAIASLLERHRVNQLPVVDDEHRVVGVVSEADLLTKVEWQGRGRPGRLARWMLEDELSKAEGKLASQVMTRDVETTGPEATVNHAAQLLMFSQVKALPVVDKDGRLVGIVSRTDILQGFLRTDESIRREVIDDLLRDALAIEPEAVAVFVEGGTVILTGEVESRGLHDIITTLVNAVTGVISVDNRIEYRRGEISPTPPRDPVGNLA
jgi:CBS-domain-containing membrane protein